MRDRQRKKQKRKLEEERDKRKGGENMSDLPSMAVNNGLIASYKSVASAMDICLVSYQRMQNASRQVIETKSIMMARAAYRDVGTEVTGVSGALEVASSKQDDLNKKMEKSGNIAKGLFDKIKSKISGIDWGKQVEKVLAMSDEFEQVAAKLTVMKGVGENVGDVQNKIFAAAQASRGSYTDMATAVATLGNNASGAFSDSNPDEIIGFAELVQKQFAIAGYSTGEAAKGMTQLTQAMNDGKLSADEMNSIFATAPNVVQSIADYMKLSTTEVKNMATEGVLTSEIFKNAMFSSATDISNKLANMPMTWEQIKNSISQTAMQLFSPILAKCNDFLNSDGFKGFIIGVKDGLYAISEIANVMFDLLAGGAERIMEGWSMIRPVILGVGAVFLSYVALLGLAKAASIASGIASGALAIGKFLLGKATLAATAAQLGLNGALAACPLMWIIGLIIAIIAIFYAVVAAVNHFTGSTYSATGIIMGALGMAVAFIYNNFLGLMDFILGIVNYWYNLFATFINYFANCWKNPISSVIYLFQGFADSILGVIHKIAEAIDHVFGSNLADTVAGWRTSVKDFADDAVAKYAPNENYEEVISKVDFSTEELLGLERMSYGDAYDTGYEMGEGLADKASGMLKMPKVFEEGDLWDNISDINTNSTATAENTGKVTQSMDITDENLVYLREIAEREIIDRTVFSTINVEMGGVMNTVNSLQDLDGIGYYIADNLQEEMSIGMEGV